MSLVTRESVSPLGAAATFTDSRRVSLSSMSTRRHSWKRCPVTTDMRCAPKSTPALTNAATAAIRPGITTIVTDAPGPAASIMCCSMSGEITASPARAASSREMTTTAGSTARVARPQAEDQNRRTTLMPA